MRNSVARIFLAVAATIPMTVMCAFAQFQSEDDISVYSQELLGRIEQGRQSGQLSATNYQNLRGLYNNVETIRQQYRNRRMSDQERFMMMTSLINLDKQLTTNLHDDQNARYQNWDPNSRSWRRNWWTRVNPSTTPGSFNFDQEIDAYQRELRERIDSGRQSGRLTSREVLRLSAQYEEIDNLQSQYRRGGFNSSEHEELINKLTGLDREITAQLHDDDRSHFNSWDPRSNSWNQNWWQSGGRGNNTASRGGFNQEIDSYQRLLKQRIDRGRDSGRITPRELSRLTASYDEIDSLQRQYRREGFDNQERNTLMSRLTQLDRDVTNELHDNDQARYNYWNPQNSSWNQNWWLPSWVPVLGRPNLPTSTQPVTGTYLEQLTADKSRIQRRMSRAQREGLLTPAEASALNQEYAALEDLQRRYLPDGFNRNEKSIMEQRVASMEANLTEFTSNDDSRQASGDGWRRRRGNSPWRDGD